MFNINLFVKSILLGLILKIQIDGNKEAVEIKLKRSFSIIKKITKNNPINIFFQAFKQIKPFCEIKSLKIGGKVYRIPVEIRSFKQQVLATKWFVDCVIERSEFHVERKISKELIETYKLSSKSLTLCENLHKTAESNKVYIQYRF
jgi:small subunit ribosomal protein S7